MASPQGFEARKSEDIIRCPRNSSILSWVHRRSFPEPIPTKYQSRNSTGIRGGGRSRPPHVTLSGAASGSHRGAPGPQLCRINPHLRRRAPHNCRPGNPRGTPSRCGCPRHDGPPACHRRGRSFPIIPLATAPMVRRSGASEPEATQKAGTPGRLRSRSRSRCSVRDSGSGSGSGSEQYPTPVGSHPNHARTRCLALVSPRNGAWHRSHRVSTGAGREPGLPSQRVTRGAHQTALSSSA